MLCASFHQITAPILSPFTYLLTIDQFVQAWSAASAAKSRKPEMIFRTLFSIRSHQRSSSSSQFPHPSPRTPLPLHPLHVLITKRALPLDTLIPLFTEESAHKYHLRADWIAQRWLQANNFSRSSNKTFKSSSILLNPS